MTLAMKTGIAQYPMTVEDFVAMLPIVEASKKRRPYLKWAN